MLKRSTLLVALLVAAACSGEPADDTSIIPDDMAGMGDMAAPAPEPLRATATLNDAEGTTVGTVTLTEGEAGVRIAGEFTGLPEGTHAFHVHTVGTCTAPDFASAGAHFNPTMTEHGLDNPQGPHAGDMQNFEVLADGSATVAVDNDRITLSEGPNSVFDADGSALVIHADPDDNVSDPAGNAGARIACGVIVAG